MTYSAFTPEQQDEVGRLLANATQQQGVLIRQLQGAPAPDLTVASGTSLPATPADGDEYDYIADSTNGVVWRFKYRSASASTYKWEFVGGTPLHSVDASSSATNETLSSSSYVYQAAASSPTVAVPLDGDWIFRWGAHAVVAQTAAQTGAQVDMAVGDGTDITRGYTLAVGIGSPPSSYSVQGAISGQGRLDGVSAGTFRLRIAGNTTSAGVFSFYDRWISATPVRVI